LWVTLRKGNINKEYHIANNALFSGGNAGYYYESDTASVMVVVPSYVFVGFDELVNFTMRVNYGSDQDTYIQKIYNINGSQGQAWGKGSIYNDNSSRRLSLYWTNKNLTSQELSNTNNSILIQNWYEASIETYGYRGTLDEATERINLDSKYFSNNLCSFVTLDQFLSESLRAPSYIVFVDTDKQEFAKKCASTLTEIYTCAAGDIQKPIVQIKFRFEGTLALDDQNTKPVVDFPIAEGSIEEPLLTPLSYFSPVYAITKNTTNTVHSFDNTKIVLKSELQFSFSYDKDCPYDFSSENITFELQKDNTTISDIEWSKQNNVFSFVLKYNVYKKTLDLTSSSPSTSGDLLNAGNYLLCAKNVRSKFNTDNNATPPRIFHNEIPIQQKEEYVAPSNFLYQIQYLYTPSTEGAASTLIDVDGRVIIPGE
jgi:hypothetical protein